MNRAGSRFTVGHESALETCWRVSGWVRKFLQLRVTEDAHRSPPMSLGFIHGSVRSVDQVFGAASTFRPNGYPDCGPDGDIVTKDRNRPLQLFLYLPSQRQSCIFARDVGKEDREL